MDNDSLGEALSSAETIAQTTPDPAQVEPTVSAPATDPNAPPDSSLIKAESDEEQPQEQPESQADRDWKELRERRDHLNNLIETYGGEEKLKNLHTTLEKVGGETNISIMQPVIERALEAMDRPPATEAETHAWSVGMFDSLSQVLRPKQVNDLKSYAAWSYINDPASAQVIVESRYGQGITPEVLDTLVSAYREIPDLLDRLRPEETWDQKQEREAREAKDRERDTKDRERDTQFKKIEEDKQAYLTQQTMGEVFKVALSPRDEVKKQYGLEYQKSDKDTPEIASFKERASRRYDQMVVSLAERDTEMNRLSNIAQGWAADPDPRKRALANERFAPLIEQRYRQICAGVAKDLAEDLTLFSPGLSDRAKAENLRGLPAQVLGGGNGQSTQTGIDFSKMPDASADPIGYQNWVARVTREASQASRTPGILQAG